jgi:recombination DNA repair RAD52 pathway protein
VELRQLDAQVVHNSDQKAGFCVGYVCVVRLTVEGCVPVSGVGYGDATEYRESAPVTAHELAAKEAESDALKRALKNFGDQFGLALYDKAAASSGHVTTGSNAASAAGSSQRVISEAQRKRLYAMSKEANLSDDELKTLVAEVAGVQSSKEIPVGKYDQLCEAVQGAALPF